MGAGGVDGKALAKELGCLGYVCGEVPNGYTDLAKSLFSTRVYLNHLNL